MNEDFDILMEWGEFDPVLELMLLDEQGLLDMESDYGTTEDNL